ncbi:ATP synthase subunit I [Cocleimonas sp. KMM 6892]|uniref:ATP synthase subunit I n=1 Tax=unclassified Cocleimonas TaxID=2639732 RepID=UPI002DBB7266|nr:MULTISPECIES: ATP synthase subunit I [unclassified Cocleimonas]MEB8434375.1 ATP synthase subunit I [Cocleimonas sp. KMM 6892]MEC4717222.1 ATP synthase subunit I [Cocleimonas sp. KMM 6895]MEC4746601.1 ATP synthase subunit I [Cocleimonas sp. KMM 6896]
MMIESINLEAINTFANWSAWLMAFLVGGFAGFVYFFGLWLTLKKLTISNNPALLMLSSLILRMAFVMFIFYLIMRNVGWQGLLIALLGLIVVRFILTRKYKPEPVNQSVKQAATVAAVDRVDTAKPI